MISYCGDFKEDATVYIPFNTFTSDDPSASSTITNLINTDIHIHKDDGLTQRNNAAGITVSVNFDSITGNHLITIDTSDDTVADFWVVGHDYFVRMEGTTIDGATVNAWIGFFSIENRFNRDDDLVAIKTKTDNLPTDPADQSLLIDATDAIIAALGALATAAALSTHDTKLTAVKAKTDNLPGSPAAVGSAMTLAGDAMDAAALKTDAITEIVTAIFAKTGITAGGSVSFNDIVKAIYALARGKIAKSGDAYAYKDDNDTTTLFTLTITASERTVS